MAKVHDHPPRRVGETRDTGFQIGVRRTLPVPADMLWQLIVSEVGVKCWLGAGSAVTLSPGTAYNLTDGTYGEVRVVQPNSHLRLSWQPGHWPRPSTMQVRIIAKGQGSTLAFHQEHLPDAQAREQRRLHFEEAIQQLAEIIGQ